MQQSVQEPLPPPPPQPKVARTNLVERVPGPTDPELYCAGYITSRHVPERQYVAAGWGSPHQTRSNDREYIYLAGGRYEEGTLYEIVRKLRDPNRWEAFPGQRWAVGGVGQPYAQVAQVKVVSVRKKIAVGRIVFSCDTVVPGDIAIPFVERTRPAFRPEPNFDRFAPPNGKLRGRILMARDFDTVIGTGRIVYLNVGANKGVKVGDYFHATRTYPATMRDEADSISAKASFNEDTQKDPRTFSTWNYDQLPRRNLGTMLVLNVSPKSATALVTFALEDILVGDGVEMFEPPPAAAGVAEPMNPPEIICVANPSTVHVGESSTITCDASSPDERPVSLSFSTSAGQITPRDNHARLETAQLQPGTVTVTGTATDDRNLSSSSPATVTVEAAGGPPTPTSQEIAFKTSGAYVNNRAKAILDGVALQLQQQADSTAVVIGYADPSERGNQTLAMRRATNVKNYLIQSGIDPGRISTRVAAEPGQRVMVWVVPAGTAPPQ
jgi:outer membrane protein OmpA-like peptidoglycan-associated protein